MRLGGLQLGGTLDRYVGGLFVAAYATAFLLVIGLSTILTLASSLDHFEPWPDGSRAPTLDVLRFYVLNVPYLYLQLGPFVTVVAGLFTITRMLKNNETIAVLAAGVSARRMLVPVLLGGVLAALGMFALREASAVTFGPKRDAIFDMLENQRRERVHPSVWFKDRRGDVVHIEEFRPATGRPPVAELRGVEVTTKRRNAYVLQRADRAVWTRTDEGARWLLEGGILEEVDNEKSRRDIQVLEDLEFTPADVLMSIKADSNPMELTFSQIDQLAARDPDNSSYQTLLQYNLTFPLANIVLLLVALPFLLGRERGRHLEGLVVGCLLCVLYFIVDFISRALGMEGTLSPLLSSWFPVLLFGSLGAVLFEGTRS